MPSWADLCPKANSPTDSQWARASKGEFQAHVDRGSTGRNSTVSSQSHLEIGHAVV